jgi:hypothetical protein
MRCRVEARLGCASGAIFSGARPAATASCGCSAQKTDMSLSKPIQGCQPGEQNCCPWYVILTKLVGQQR